MNKRLLYVVAFFAVILILPGTYSLGERLIAKSHIQKGCKAFMQDSGLKNPNEVGIFQSEFSKAALMDPTYIPIAKASDSLDTNRRGAELSGFETEWLDALSTVQGLCWSFIKE